MKDFIERLALLIHWIGFLCLVFFIVSFGLALTPNGGLPASEALEALFEVLLFEEGAFSAILWIGIAHWPIKWFITSNKAFFPWKR